MTSWAVHEMTYRYSPSYLVGLNAREQGLQLPQALENPQGW